MHSVPWTTDRLTADFRIWIDSVCMSQKERRLVFRAVRPGLELLFLVPFYFSGGGCAAITGGNAFRN